MNWHSFRAISEYIFSDSVNPFWGCERAEGRFGEQLVL